MSAVQKKLNSAYKRVAAVFGETFKVYRPLYLDDALDEKNFIFKRQASFSMSAGIVDTPTDSFKQFVCYVDSDGIQVGDIFVGTDTYVIVGSPNLGTLAAVKVTTAVEIWGTQSNTSGEYATVTPVRIAKNVPATLSGAASDSGASLPNAASTTPKVRYTIRVWTPSADIAPSHSLKIGDDTLKITGIEIRDLFQLITAVKV